MILASLEIRDYKQFAGEYALRLESQGIVGVIGPNGAGKTTLFEAIEWCLYGPRSIATADVFPRGREGKPRVSVTLEHPDTGERFVIEREIRGKTMRANVWREENPDEILATGSAPVRAYVSEKLIGLGHDAFVSTFFTRQKELSFFGSLRPTERRIMIGRLIGVEAVRIAQESIGLERSQAAQRAEGLAAQVEHEQQGRDFAAEIAYAEERAKTATEFVDLRSAEHAATREALERAERTAEIIRIREQRDRELAEQLAVPERSRARLQAEIDAIERDLARLEHERTRRDPLHAIAQQHTSHNEAVANWNTARERKRQLDVLLKRADQLQREQAVVTTASATIVDETSSVHVSEWVWTSGLAPEQAIASLIQVAEHLDLRELQERATQFERLLGRADELQRTEADLRKYRARLDALASDERAALAAGDPAVALKRIDDRITDLQAGESRAASEAAQAEQHLAELQPLIAHLRGHRIGGLCPTCGREIAEAEFGNVLMTLEKQGVTWSTQRDTRRAEVKRSIQLLSEQRQLRADEQKRIAALAEIRTRIESGQQFVADKARDAERFRNEVRELLTNSGRTSMPTPDEVADLKSQVAALTDISRAAVALRQRLSQLSETVSASAAVTIEITSLGEVIYDETAHSRAECDLKDASAAIATLAQIDRELARQPTLVIERGVKRDELVTITNAWTAITNERLEHAFDPKESLTAREAVAIAARQERTATTALHDAQTAMRERVNEARALAREQARLADLLDRSIALRREADELDRMYREFATFDQYVAARIAPRLAEQTSELLGYATDGKYDRVEFDENYGINVFDGDDDKFALEGFSGGERDVVALCARLALSQVIASAAANPPSFLVLDEVFGALDRDRRAQLLDLLGQLSQQTSQFQQMFVISHVDDVRSSPVFSRVWRIVETEDGISRIEDATGSAAKFDE